MGSYKNLCLFFDELAITIDIPYYYSLSTVSEKFRDCPRLTGFVLEGVKYNKEIEYSVPNYPVGLYVDGSLAANVYSNFDTVYRSLQPNKVVVLEPITKEVVLVGKKSIFKKVDHE